MEKKTKNFIHTHLACNCTMIKLLTNMAIRIFFAVSTKGLNVEALERNFSISNSICHSLPLSEEGPPPVEDDPTVTKSSYKSLSIINTRCTCFTKNFTRQHTTN